MKEVKPVGRVLPVDSGRVNGQCTTTLRIIIKSFPVGEIAYATRDVTC